MVGREKIHKLNLYILSDDNREEVVNWVSDALYEYFEIIHEREPEAGEIILDYCI